MRITILALLLVLGPGQAHALSLNDVSVLLPLPTPLSFHLLMGPQSDGGHGALLPKDVYENFPQLIPETSNGETYQKLLRVVAIRLDPCFSEGAKGGPCRRQIRMVWQPILTSDTATTTRDAAIHTFYEFSSQEWIDILKVWKTLSSGRNADALQVHPRINAEGLDGPYWQKLRSLVLKYCGRSTLVRATMMNVQLNEQMWTFMGFDIENGIAKRMSIPRINANQQSIIMSPHNTTEFKGAIRPTPRQNQDLDDLLRNSTLVESVLDEQSVQGIVRKAFRFENPKLNNPGTVDCASCHVAQSVRQWGERNFKDWDWATVFQSSRFEPSKFESTANVTNITPFKTNQFRAFGYFNEEPSISQRVINETVVVLNSL